MDSRCLLRRQLLNILKVTLKKPLAAEGLQLLKKNDKLWNEMKLLSSKAIKNEIGHRCTVKITTYPKSRTIFFRDNTTWQRITNLAERLGLKISTQANPHGSTEVCSITKHPTVKEEDPFITSPNSKDLNYKCDLVIQFVPKKSSIYTCSSVIYPRKLFNFLNTHQLMQNRHLFGGKCPKPKDCSKKQKKKKKICLKKKKKKTQPCKMREPKEEDICKEVTARTELDEKAKKLAAAEARRLADEAARKTKEEQAIDALEDEESGLEEERQRGNLDKLRVQPVVAIIGGGLAGLSAAAHLAKAGIKHFRIFEATPRVGGRINTSDLGSGTVELGAEWLAGGGAGNPVYLLAADEGLLNGPTDFESSVDKTKIFLSSDGGMMPVDLSSLAIKIFEKVRGDAIKLFGLRGREKHGSLSHYMKTRIDEELAMLPLDSRQTVLRIVTTLVNNVRIRWGTELMKMSSDLYGSFQDVPGPQIKLNRGMINVLRPLLNEIPPSNILCNSPVQTILWGDGAARVVVVLQNGCEYLADYAIVTVPLGHLKENHKTMFYPPLPEDKANAIENLGVGRLTKIYLKYAQGIWGKRRTKVNTVWNLRDWTDRGIVWYKGISHLEVIDDLLTCVVAGEEAAEVEELPLKNVADDMTKVLRKFAGHGFIPRPVDVLASKWNTDPYFKGSVTYMSTKDNEEDVEILAKPLPRMAGESLDAPKIYFAGEAAAPGQFGSAHGAKMSGTREAEMIIQQTIDFQGPPPQPTQHK